MKFASLPKLKAGDSVAIVSPSWEGAAIFPMELELGLSRLREQFGLIPVEMPHTRAEDASHQDKMNDLIQAFSDPEIKAVITTVGGDHQIEYVHRLPEEPFLDNPKPFFGYSDNTHLSNFLFRLGIPSFYGGSVYTEFAMQGSIGSFTERYLRKALFEGGTVELETSAEFNDEDLEWGEKENLTKTRRFQPNEGWYWSGERDGRGYTWGGCLESIDEILRHGRELPSLTDFERIVLFFETCEEIPPSYYVSRVVRAFGERGILERVQGVLVGRPKAWNRDQQLSDEAKVKFKEAQRETVLGMVRRYNPSVPVVQNLDFGHTAPSLCLPYGGEVEILAKKRAIKAVY